ncbi:MAG: hypothetical protein KGQ58_07345 [Proteobacteria bacterium]|nr:hypothetical protein [Pseudomonadota bacterium]MDE3208387.1 hypothetical protein [Pseudomonadota bacterium]
MGSEDNVITVAEPDGMERMVVSLEEARRVVWKRMKALVGSDKDAAQTLLEVFAEKSSFYDLDAADCFDLSYLFLTENRQVLFDDLMDLGLVELLSRLNLSLK